MDKKSTTIFVIRALLGSHNNIIAQVSGSVIRAILIAAGSSMRQSPAQ